MLLGAYLKAEQSERDKDGGYISILSVHNKHPMEISLTLLLRSPKKKVICRLYFILR